MKASHRNLAALLFPPVALLLGILTIGVATDCGRSSLTPDQAEQELDVACGVLVRTVTAAHHKLPLGILYRVCEGKQSRELIEHLVESIPTGMIEETFPEPELDDAGVH